jgi:hypothetical protein
MACSRSKYAGALVVVVDPFACHARVGVLSDPPCDSLFANIENVGCDVVLEDASHELQVRVCDPALHFLQD